MNANNRMVRTTDYSSPGHPGEVAHASRLQSFLNNVQAAVWSHRHLLAFIADAEDLDGSVLNEKFREVTATIAACGSVAQIRAALNMDPLVHGPASA